MWPQLCDGRLSVYAMISQACSISYPAPLPIQPPAQALWTAGSVSEEFKSSSSSAWCMWASLLASVSPSMQWGCFTCLPWGAAEAAEHLGHTQWPESQATILLCETGLAGPFWVDQLFRDDLPPFKGFPGLSQAAPSSYPVKEQRGRSKVG